MVKQVDLPPHNLGSSIIQTGISAVREMDRNSLPCSISGGIAVQTYLPEELRRQTVDLDFVSMTPGTRNPEELEKYTFPLTRYLSSLGYGLELTPKRDTFDYTITDPNNNDSLLIQHIRRNKNHFGKNLHSLEREIENSKEFEYRDGKFKALSPEDISVKKLNRIMKFSQQYKLENYPREISLEDRRISARKLRESVISSISDQCPEDLAKDIALLRIMYDCFDIQALASHANIDEKYLSQIISEWGKGRFSERDYRGLMESLSS